MEIKIEKISYPSAETGETIYGEIWMPSSAPKGIVQFSHGMCDYGGRYQEFYAFLVKKGYIAGYHDHLGHGETVSKKEDLGYFAKENGDKKLVQDFTSFYYILEQRFPRIPHYVVGHSMGSFVVRCFLTEGKGDGAIWMGTANKNPMADMGIALAKIIERNKGGRHPSPFLTKLSFMGYHKKIKNTNHPWAWLSTKPEMMEDMLNNPKRNMVFSTAGFKDLFTLVKDANLSKTLDATPKNLPILLISGAEDPLGPYEKGILKLQYRLKKNGFRHVSVKIFPNARHELCHEVICDDVYAYIVHWLDEITKGGSSL